MSYLPPPRPDDEPWDGSGPRPVPGSGATPDPYGTPDPYATPSPYGTPDPYGNPATSDQGTPSFGAPPPSPYGAPPPASPYGPYGPYGSGPVGSPPANHLVWAILTTILCCMPAGVVAIVFAAQVNGKWAAGDVQGARQSSTNARTWAIVSAVLGAIGIIFVIIAGVTDSASSY